MLYLLVWYIFGMVFSGLKCLKLVMKLFNLYLEIFEVLVEFVVVGVVQVVLVISKSVFSNILFLMVINFLFWGFVILVVYFFCYII